ncbi:discoidin domain-containing protein [Lachnospiraceae bacterium 29-84]
MKGFKKCVSAVTAAAMLFTSVWPSGGLGLTVQAAPGERAAVETSVRLLPEKASPFNDMNKDGLGEFQGWGTSLCWWANRLGYSQKMTQQAAEYFFSDEGLDMNIGRYNIGGGDNVGEITPITPNENAQFYDLETEGRTPTYGGSSMKVSENDSLNEQVFSISDADFGFTQGQAVGKFKVIGWINKLDDAVGSGDKLNYTVNVPKAGSYTVKLLMLHNSNTKRDVAIRVNDDAENGTYIVDNASVQASKIVEVSSENAMTLFSIAIPDVNLREGDNSVKIAGAADWTLDFVKMAVIESGKEGEVQGTDFLHPAHIKRSDSVVPGYWKDVTKIELEEHPIEWYQQHFDRADAECGYAWNYNWDKDKNQMNILKAAAQASGEDFLAEAFSNSPPYFMTNSGCSSGATDASKDNLRKDSYHAFATYMADIIVHWAKEGVVNFQSVTPMNEPYTNYWGANSQKQEGCHFDQGASESDIIVELHEVLMEEVDKMEDGPAKEAIRNIVFSGTDETSIDTQIDSYKKLSNEAKNIITRIDTHTYSGSKRTELSDLAEAEGKNLWMSEIDGASEAGTDAGEMTAALGFAQRIMLDVNNLRCSAWIMWNAVDLNVDEDNEFDANTIDELMNKKNDAGEVMYNPVKGFWGIAIGDHNTENIVLTKKYEALGQFSRYIRPGYAIIGSNSGNTLAAYDPEGKKAVIVAMNTQGEDKTWKFDLSRFVGMGNTIKAYRTSGSVANGEKWADVSATDNITLNAEEKSFTATMKANSITTYIVEGVDFDQEYADNLAIEEELKEDALKDALVKLDLNKDMVTGSAPWKDDPKNGASNVVDGDYNTFFDGVTNGWVQIDLGADQTIGALGYAPRSGFSGRCVGASFYGSKDGEEWTRLYTISNSPPAGQATLAYATQFASDDTVYRYIKYAVPEGDESANCNIAEIEVYSIEEGFQYPESLQDWIDYYQAKVEGHKYTEDTKDAYDKALSEAQALLGSSDEAAKKAARNKLVEAYKALKEIIVYNSFSGVNGAVRRDTKGDVIQAHGGQIQQVTYDKDSDGEEETFWYWIGEDKTNDYRPCPGVHVYISDDLYNWEDKGCVLRTVPNWETFTTDPYFTELYGDMPEDQKKAVYGDLWTADNATDGGCVIERPKMIYNDKTKKYVIWFHADGQTPDSTGGNYAKAKAGVAISDSPFGPFQLQGSYLLNYDEDADHGFDEEVGGHVRDMNLFKDDDGAGYVIYSSDGNQTLHIAKLNDTYTNVAKPQGEAVEGEDFTRNFIDMSREAPAMFKYNNKYYIITSGCTGWAPNRASYAVADHPLGPWTTMGDPCTDEGSDKTYETQSTCVFPVDAAKGQFIYMGDRWRNPDNGGSLRDSRYVWLPVEFLSGNKIALRRYSDWTLDTFKDLAPFEVKTELPQTAATVDELRSKLPSEIEIQYASETAVNKVNVTWSGFPEEEDILGTITLTGTLGNGRVFTHSVDLLNSKMIYFFDCYAQDTECSYLEHAKEVLKDALRNTKADQAYSEETKAGYAGEYDVDFGGKSENNDIWSRGYWAKSNKNIDYAFELEAGRYTVSTGYQEWWNTSRPTRITVTSEINGELATHDFTLANTATSQQEDISFTLTQNDKVTVSISKTGGADPVLSWIAVMQDEKFTNVSDKSKLNETIKKASALKKADYTKATWEAFEKALNSAKSVQANVTAEQSVVDAANTTLDQAMKALKSLKSVLEEGIRANTLADSEKSKYTDESWAFYQEMLKEAKDMLSKGSLVEIDVNDAVKAVKDAIAILEKKDSVTPPKPPVKKNQVIKYTKTYQKAYGAKAFSLGAKVTTGNGSLSYKSSDTKVATVSKSGKVTLKGTGICTIKVTAAATSQYNAKSVSVTLKVSPKAAALVSLKAVKGKKLTVKWKKDSKASGYQIQYSTSKKFKSAKSIKVKNSKTTSTTIKKLKAGKKYYVRIRAYKTVKVNGKSTTLNGAWSKAKTSKKIKK